MKRTLKLSRETIRTLSGKELHGAIGGIGAMPKMSDKGDCDTQATSSNPGNCKSAFVSDCGRCD